MVLVADESVYHIQCHAQFFFNARSADGNQGRPKYLKMQSVFNFTCDWLENEVDLFTVKDFLLKMEQVCSNEVYGVKIIKKSCRRSTKKIYSLLKRLEEKTLHALGTWPIG